ncbi:hypothetical protein BDU57DRAFT_527647 [Ampelomyces quisqualis]|uniref:Uncharacterized protein n=1 Tax=Ampelomyces quisqualis TaxID=50730 RepID=A0A6A5QWB2_AMPQU|nr:hypothetical protein BDU57DRAFT_527647 [Ampelomyces quisqualis]
MPELLVINIRLPMRITTITSRMPVLITKPMAKNRTMSILKRAPHWLTFCGPGYTYLQAGKCCEKETQAYLHFAMGGDALNAGIQFYFRLALRQDNAYRSLQMIHGAASGHLNFSTGSKYGNKVRDPNNSRPQALLGLSADACGDVPNTLFGNDDF